MQIILHTDSSGYSQHIIRMNSHSNRQSSYRHPFYTGGPCFRHLFIQAALYTRQTLIQKKVDADSRPSYFRDTAIHTDSPSEQGRLWCRRSWCWQPCIPPPPHTPVHRQPIIQAALRAGRSSKRQLFIQKALQTASPSFLAPLVLDFWSLCVSTEQLFQQILFFASVLLSSLLHPWTILLL